MHLHPLIFAAAIIAITTAQSPVHTPVSHEIAMAADSYRPTELTVARGDTIVWFNTDIVTHTATSRGGNWGFGAPEARQTIPLGSGDSWPIRVYL